MMKFGIKWSLLSFLLVSQGVQAQIISPDQTLSTTVSQPQLNQFVVEGGTRTGVNLFHSFSYFSVPTNGVVRFNNPLDIQNIFTRITGNVSSTIDGLIQVNGTANLFLLNPNGILFGPNAALQTGGSFIGTTGNMIKFSDGVQFSAHDTTLNPLLTINSPIGLQLGQNPGSITVQQSGHQLEGSSQFAVQNTNPSFVGLQVGTDKTLALVGGSVTLDGGVLTAPSGRIELGAIGPKPGNSEVKIQTLNGYLQLSYDQVQPTGDLQLMNKSLIDASGTGQGSIQIRGRNLRMQDGSIIWLNNFGTQVAGSIDLNVVDAIELVGFVPNTELGSGIYSEVENEGRGSDINIQTNQLILAQGGSIYARTSSDGDSGQISINSSSIHLTDTISNQIVNRITTLTLDRGKGGDLMINTNYLRIQGGGVSASSFFGTGNSGNILINAKESIDLSISNPNLDDAIIGASAVSATANAGNITLNTARLLLRDGALISSSTYGSGKGGNITVNASEEIKLSGGRYSPTREIFEGSSIRASGILLPFTARRGRFALTPQVTGTAGDIMINTPNLKVMNQAEIAVRHSGVGRAGTLEISSDLILLDQQGRLSAASATGNGGNIIIQADRLLSLRHGSSILTTVEGGEGNGGNIRIVTPVIVGFENSDIVASAVKGNGGNIYFKTQGLFGLTYQENLTKNSDITASSDFGVDGSVQIIRFGLDPRVELVELPSNVIDSMPLIMKGCSGISGNTQDKRNRRNTSQTISRFWITGSGGLPDRPQDLPIPVYDLGTVRSFDGVNSKMNQIKDPILKSHRFELDLRSLNYHFMPSNENCRLNPIRP